ncbi:MAG: C40 family peptidase [Bacteroidetes bacterium]|nr:C40 family peptidase [Bacteroidota bacterium]
MEPGSTLFCSVPVAPLRSEPQHRSEQVSQILWGEELTLLDQLPSWIHVRSCIDGYTGWISQRQCLLPTDPLPTDGPRICSDWALVQTPSMGPLRCLSMGSVLRPFLGLADNCLVRGASSWTVDEKPDPRTVLDRGMAWLGTPYLWGGRSRFGVDCSGLVQVLWGSVGVTLPRDASEQLRLAPFVYDLEDPRAWQAGHLAFFSENSDRITHVGLLTGDGRVLHASGEVRLDPINNEGIQPMDNRPTHPHRLAGIASFYTPSPHLAF